MKKIFFFTAIAFLTLSSCKKEATTLATDQTSVQSQLQTNANGSQLQTNASSGQLQTNASSSGGAFPFNDQYTFNLAGTQIYNPCTNELMTGLTWGVHWVIHGIYNGNKSTGSFHGNNTGIKLIGESGVEYVGSGGQNFQESYFSDGVFTTKIVRHTHCTTASGGNNWMFSETYYIKVYADGTITYIRDPVLETRCQ